MKTWRVKAGLIIMSAVCIAGGIIAPFLPDKASRDIFASGLVLGGLAMLTVALWRSNGRPGE